MDLFFDLLRSLIYGVIEGITEWLPISSTCLLYTSPSPRD